MVVDGADGGAEVEAARTESGIPSSVTFNRRSRLCGVSDEQRKDSSSKESDTGTGRTVREARLRMTCSNEESLCAQ